MKKTIQKVLKRVVLFFAEGAIKTGKKHERSLLFLAVAALMLYFSFFAAAMAPMWIPKWVATCMVLIGFAMAAIGVFTMIASVLPDRFTKS
jgi:protein-S-isoprenylcysteine O-methyltransferase Ste14